MDHPKLKWYDYLAAFIAADLMTSFIFSSNIIGGIAAYSVYYCWNDIYCEWRKVNVQ